MEETNELSLQLIQVPHSPFCQSVAIAFAEKGVPFSVVNEDLRNKSQLLLEANPVHKKVPALIHNGRSIAESCVIVEYIEDTWPDRYSLFPETSYEKAQARFWVDLIEVRIGATLLKMTQLRDSEIDKAAFEEGMLLLNSAIVKCAGDERPFFFGNRLGYVDIMFAPFMSWFPSFDKYVDLQIPSSTQAPRLNEWMAALSEHPTVKPLLTDPVATPEFILEKVGGYRSRRSHVTKQG